MDVDGDGNTKQVLSEEEEIPTCSTCFVCAPVLPFTFCTDTSIEAPPSVWPQKHYCDITGLEVGSGPASLDVLAKQYLCCTGSVHGPSYRSEVL